jgi:hypothetical protein
VERSERSLAVFGEYLGCYFIDSTPAVTALLEVARGLSARQQRQRPTSTSFSPPT